MVDDGEQEQWLVSCWRTQNLRDALAEYAGHSLHGLMASLAPVLGRYEVKAGEAAPWVDCDTPEELAWARRWVEAGNRDGTEGVQGEHA